MNIDYKKLNRIKILSLALALTVPLYALTLWFTIQSQYFSFGNNSWLLVSANRLLQGQSLLDHIYETNPPLSILIYVPHVILSYLTQMPMPIAAFYMTSTMIAVSLTILALILKRFDFLNTTEKLLFLITTLIALTIATGIQVSEREHMIMIWIIPFILCQFAITEHIKTPKHLYIPAIIIGSIFILVKPHYGIIPSAIFITRMIRQKKFFGIMKDIDFIILSTTTIAYILFIFIFFNDYATLILPDVIHLYTQNINFANTLPPSVKYIKIAIPLLIFELIMEDIKGKKKRFVNMLHLCLFLSFIPYFVQMKGFSYHLIPIYGFFIMALAASIIVRMDKLPINKLTKLFLPILCASCILLFTLNFSPLSTKTLTHNDVKTIKTLKYIENNCDAPCSYFAFHADMEIFNPINAYTDMTHATRFPVLWFLPTLYSNTLSEDQHIKQKAERLKEKYGNYIAEDIERYKPDLLIIAKDLPLGQGKSLNLMEFFGEIPEIKEIMEKQYRKKEEVTFDYKEYYKGTNFKGLDSGYTYNVYKRNQ